jgi:hypothetical protein
LTRPTLRIVSVLLYALALAAAVVFHILWLRGLMTMPTQLKLTGITIAVVAASVVFVAVLGGMDKKAQRGFRVIFKDERQS